MALALDDWTIGPFRLVDDWTVCCRFHCLRGPLDERILKEGGKSVVGLEGGGDGVLADGSEIRPLVGVDEH